MDAKQQAKIQKERDKRRDFCQAVVTLDGRPAKISGAYNPMATVWNIDAPADGVDFSWQAVERIVATGGNFRR